MLKSDDIRAEYATIRAATTRPVNLNFFCHRRVRDDAPEALISDLHARALRSPASARTALTNVFTGRPARSIETRLMREVGPLSDDAPPFPRASGALIPLRRVAEQHGDTSFTSLWSGQAARLAREVPAGELTKLLAEEALQCLRALRTM